MPVFSKALNWQPKTPNSSKKSSAPQFSPVTESLASYKSAAKAPAPRLPALISPRKISEKSLRSAIRSGNSFNAPSPTKFLAKICDRPQNISSIACIGSLVPLQIVKRNLGNALTHQNLLVTFPQHKIFMSYPYGGTAHRHHGVRR